MAAQRKQPSKKITISSKARWNSLLKEIDTKDVPISMIDRVDIKMIDGSTIEIDVTELLAEGHSPSKLEKDITTKIRDMDHIIEDVEFYVSVDSVVKTVTPITKKIFKDFK